MRRSVLYRAAICVLMRIPVNDLLESIEEKMDSSHGQVCRKPSCGESVKFSGAATNFSQAVVYES
jgi:hypothetical protein